MDVKDVVIGKEYIFSKSGNRVVVVQRSQTGHNHFVAKRVNKDRELLVTSDGLEEIPTK